MAKIKWLLCAAGFVLATLPVHAFTAQEERLMSLRQMVDKARTEADLEKAAALAQLVLVEDPESLEGNVQATRIVLMRGATDAGAPEAVLTMAERFIDKAIAVTNGRYVPALPLKAEILLLRGDLPHAKEVLDRARALDSQNPWVRLQLAHYYEAIRQGREALEEYTQVFRWGPQGRIDQVRAYPQALVGMAGYFVVPAEANLEELRHLAQLADQVRAPDAAWPLPEFARMFFSLGDFDDAVALARKSYAAQPDDVQAQQQLANVLYAQAAIMVRNKQDPAALLNEAAALRYHPAGLTCAFRHGQPPVRSLLPIVVSLLPVRGDARQRLLMAEGCGSGPRG